MIKILICHRTIDVDVDTLHAVTSHVVTLDVVILGVIVGFIERVIS